MNWMVKSNFVLITVLVLINSCSPLSKVAVRKVNKKNYGVKTGLWIESIDTNQVLIAKYKGGVKNGAAKIVYRNGTFVILNYKNDKKDGYSKYYVKGKLCYILIYKNDTLKGQNIYCEPTW